MRRKYKVKLIVNYQLLFYHSSYDHFLYYNKTFVKTSTILNMSYKNFCFQLFTLKNGIKTVLSIHINLNPNWNLSNIVFIIQIYSD